MRPSILHLGGEENFAAYQKEFDRLFSVGVVNDVLGNRVIFDPHACRHICFKEKQEDKRRNLSPRTEWRQDRAERIPWILIALTIPNFIRPAPGNAWAYMLEIDRDSQLNLRGELYVVIVHTEGTTPHTPGAVHFATAHPVTMEQWNNYKKTYPRIHPLYQAEPPNKKKKDKPQKG